MSGTDGDRAKAADVLAGYRAGPGAITDVIAAALAEERQKARAPFLALADELEREGRKEEAEAERLGRSVSAESWWGSGAASLDAAARIRRAAEVDA